jgi:hypothetical protein
MRLIYAYALFLFTAFAAALAALIFYVKNDYYAAAVSALVAGTAYLATRIILLLISRRE